MQSFAPEHEATIAADAAERHLNLAIAELSDDYFYASVPLCVIDAVYSIGVRYEGVRRVVARYCDKTGQRRIRPDRTNIPGESEQESIEDFCERFEAEGLERMTRDFFNNRQRTSPRSGILKAEAVYLFASAIRKFGANYFQDIEHLAAEAQFEETIRRIPGQKSGISLQYFWMLAGSDELVKPDRMIVRFLESALQRPVNVSEALPLLRSVCNKLRNNYPELTPRLLDYEIWQFQREQDTRGDA
jgi:hypothetical protein